MKCILLFTLSLLLSLLANTALGHRIPLRVTSRVQQLQPTANEQQLQQQQGNRQQKTFRIDCNTFCRASRFHGILGGCRCGYVLFVKKRREEPTYDQISLEEPVKSNFIPLFPLLRAIHQRKLIL